MLESIIRSDVVVRIVLFGQLLSLLQDPAIMLLSLGYFSPLSFVGQTSAAGDQSVFIFLWSFIFSRFFGTLHPFHFSFEFSLLELSFVVFSVLQSQDPIALELPLRKCALITSSVRKYYFSLSIKSIISELPVVLEMIIFEYTFFPLSTLKFSLKLIVWPILLAYSMKKTVSEITSVILILVFDGQSIAMRQFFLKFAKVNMIFLIELTIAHFLLVVIHLPSKNGTFLTAINRTGFNLMRILLSKFIDFLQQSGIVDTQIFPRIRQPDPQLALATKLLSHRYLLYYQIRQRILYQIISHTLHASHTCFYNSMHRDYQYIRGKRIYSERRSLQQLTDEYSCEMWGMLIRLVVEDFFVMEQWLAIYFLSSLMIG